MTMPEYENLNKDELALADHYFETGNFADLAKLQKLSAERGGQPTNSISANTILNTHTIRNNVDYNR
jgi:hypothetical protein